MQLGHYVFDRKGHHVVLVTAIDNNQACIIPIGYPMTLITIKGRDLRHLRVENGHDSENLRNRWLEVGKRVGMSNQVKAILKRRVMPFDLLNENVDRYKRQKVIRNDGSKVWVRDNGDEVSKALRPLTDAEMDGVAEENGLEDRVQRLRQTMNAGQIRMTLGQMLRVKINKGHTVTVQGTEIDSLGDS